MVVQQGKEGRLVREDQPGQGDQLEKEGQRAREQGREEKAVELALAEVLALALEQVQERLVVAAEDL